MQLLKFLILFSFAFALKASEENRAIEKQTKSRIITMQDLFAYMAMKEAIANKRIEDENRQFMYDLENQFYVTGIRKRKKILVNHHNLLQREQCMILNKFF